MHGCVLCRWWCVCNVVCDAVCDVVCDGVSGVVDAVWFFMMDRQTFAFLESTFEFKLKEDILSALPLSQSLYFL